MTTAMKRMKTTADGPQPPKPPRNDNGEDPWEHDPEGKPSLDSYLEMPVSLQSKWYDKVVRHRVTIQRLYLRETASALAASWADVNGRVATEQDIRGEMAFLAENQRCSLEQSNRWLQNPRDFRLSDAITTMYSGEYLDGDEERATRFFDLIESLQRQEDV